MIREPHGDLLLYEEYVPIQHTLVNHGHVLLRAHLMKFVENSIREDAIEKLHERRQGRTNFLPPSIELPPLFTDKLVDALREPVNNPKSTGIVGREALVGFLASYDAAVALETPIS